MARIALGAVFLSAALSKTFDPLLFAEQIAGYALTPASWSVWQAHFFLFVETLLGVALIAGFRPRLTIPAGILLVLFFMGVLAVAAARGYRGACGCFGQGSGGVTQALVEDAVFLVVGLVAWFGLRGRRSAARGRHRWQLVVTALGAIAGVVAPIAGSTLPLPVFATAARTGARFDHVVIEEFAGKIDEGDHLVAILDPVSPASSGAVDLLDALAADAALPPVVGVVQGDNAAMVAFLFEQAPAFDAMGHAPRDALRRFYRRLPVVLALHDGVIAGAWHESVPSAADVSAAYGKIQER